MCFLPVINGKTVRVVKKGFIKKATVAAAEAVPKFTTRLISEGTDSTIFTRVKELRNVLTSAFKRSGNFGYAETNIAGLSKSEFYAHSSIDTFTGELPQRVPDISLLPENPVFDALKVNSDNVIEGADAYLRIYDSEYKILNDIASSLGNNTSASGTIKLFTEKPPCPITEIKDNARYVVSQLLVTNLKHTTSNLNFPLILLTRLVTSHLKRATTPHRTGKLEDGGCAVQIEVLTPTHFFFELKNGMRVEEGGEWQMNNK